MKENKDKKISQVNGKQPNFQFQLAVVEREIENSHIDQRLLDGYINATALCKACGKEMKHYLSNASTKAFVDELSSEVGIPTSALIQIVRGRHFYPNKHGCHSRRL